MDKKSILMQLQRQNQIYLILSKCTRLPFVYCDPETFDDEIFVYFEEAAARIKSEELNKSGELVVVVTIRTFFHFMQAYIRWVLMLLLWTEERIQS